MEVAQAKDRADFETRLVAFAQAMEFDYVSAALSTNRPGLAPDFQMIANTPAAFVEASRDLNNVRRDPVFRRMKAATVPFIYDQLLYVSEDAGDLWEHQAPFGYKTGIAMALHLPDGQQFMLGVDRSDPLPSDDHLLTRMMADLHLLAAFAQETACRLLSSVPRVENQPPKLTPRELEVLRWTKEGKSAWDIATIMAISESTVNFHLRSAGTKFGVASKHTAVLRALSLRLI